MSETKPLVDTPARTVEKPWGREIWWAQTDRYVGKIIEVKAGGSLSLQYHERKMESMYFVEGSGTLLLGDREIPIRPGLHVTIPPLTRHRVIATRDTRFFEVSSPEVEDVVRLEDAYGRAGTSD
ncbi:MAG: cupin domain-containing protein [Bacillota bacterium]|nr:cupin domain-containing protein [Bacillota bacterium]